MKYAATAILIAILCTGRALAGPLQIESNQLDIQHARQRAIFTGDAHLIRDEFELWSDKLVAYYEAGSGRLERAEAFGHVRMKKLDKRGSSDKAVLDNLKQTITLIGHAEMQQEGDIVRGSTIVHDMQTDHTEVLQGETGRVKMRIDSEAEALRPQASHE